MEEQPVTEIKSSNIGQWLKEAFNLTVSSEDLALQLLIGLALTVAYLLLIATVIGPVFLFMPTACGVFYFCKKRILGQSVEFSDIFRGFDVFQEALVASLILLPFFLVATFGTILLCIPFVCVPPLILVIVLSAKAAIFSVILFIPGLLFEQKMKAWDAIRASAELATKNFWQLFFYSAVLVVSSTVGIICTGGLGLIIILPFLGFAMTIAYRDTVEE